MSEQEQNRRINELRREVGRLQALIVELQNDVAPSGHISEGFDRLVEEIDEIKGEMYRHYRMLDKRFDSQSHQINRVLARQEVMLQALTKIDDLPEE